MGCSLIFIWMMLLLCSVTRTQQQRNHAGMASCVKVLKVLKVAVLVGQQIARASLLCLCLLGGAQV